MYNVCPGGFLLLKIIKRGREPIANAAFACQKLQCGIFRKTVGTQKIVAGTRIFIQNAAPQKPNTKT